VARSISGPSLPAGQRSSGFSFFDDPQRTDLRQHLVVEVAGEHGCVEPQSNGGDKAVD